MKRFRVTVNRVLVAGGLALVLAACSPQFRNYGYVPSDEDLANVLVGIDTRDSVAETVGTPGAAGVVSDGNYYYVSSRRKTVPIRAPIEIDRQVVAITFDSEGVVENIERFGLERGRVVALSRRVTDSNTQGIGFIRQLLGSVGQFSADQILPEG